MTRQRPDDASLQGVTSPGVHERNLAARSGLRIKQLSIPVRDYTACIGEQTCSAADVTTYTDGNKYPRTHTTAAKQAGFNPEGVLPFPCTPSVTLIHQTEEAAGATGSGRANNGSASPAKTFQVKLFGYDEYGNAIEEELPEQTVDDPSHLFAFRTVYASKVFTRITNWQFKYSNMVNFAGTGDVLQVGFKPYFNRNRPLYIFRQFTGGDVDFTYKGQTVTLAPGDFATATALKTALETLSNINAGEVKIDEPAGSGGGTYIQPYRVWIDNSNSGSGTPMLGADVEDRTQIFIDSTNATGGKAASWIASPRYINQDNIGFGMTMISDVYGKDTPYQHPELLTGSIEMVAVRAAGLNSGLITDPADAPGTADILRDDLVANTIPSIEARLDALAADVTFLGLSKINDAGTRISAGLDFGLNASGVNGAQNPNKFSLFLERFNPGLELSNSDSTGDGRYDALYDDVSTLTDRYNIHLTLRTTRGMGRDASPVANPY